jgi:hypothetical protein
MRKTIYYILVLISLIGIPFFSFGVLNVMVSLKYETDYPPDCISAVSGKNLCLIIWEYKGLAVLCLATFVLLLVFRKRILKSA